MRVTSQLLAGRRYNSEKTPVPFQSILPLKLRTHVSGKGDNRTEVHCIYEMSVMFACFKENEFNQSLCSKEIENFQTCFKQTTAMKNLKKEREAKGILTPGDKKMSSRQLNQLLSAHPNVE